MKKYLAIILAVMMMLTALTACGGNNAGTADGTTAGDTTVNDVKTNDTGSEATGSDDSQNAANGSEKIVNDDGEEFIVDTTVRGVISGGAEGIDSEKVTIGGVSYDFPIKVSELMDNGWYFPSGISFDNEFEANSDTSLINIYLINADGSQLDLDHVVNNSDETKGIEDCYLTKFGLQMYDCREGFDFVLPGGITKNSTAADVLEVFGNPNDAAEFSYGYNLDKQLYYWSNNTSGITYNFTFNDDGTLYSFTMGYEG